MNSAHNTARQHQQQQYNKSLCQRSFEPGDLVYKLDSSTKVGISTKLRPVYDGPYLVSQVISPVLYRIEGRKRSSVLHHDRLRICQDRDIPMWIRRKRHLFLTSESPAASANVEPDDDWHLQHLFEDPSMANMVDQARKLVISLPTDVPQPSPTLEPDLQLPISRTGRQRKKPGHLRDYDLNF